MKRISILSAGLALAVTAALAGCTTTDSERSPNAGGELTEVRVGIIPFAELAAFYIAIDEGIFEDEGLSVEPTQASGGATIVSSLAAGDIQFAYSNYISVFEAANAGLPIEIIRENDRPGAQAVYVLADSGIQSPQDLAGKSIAINSLGNIMEITSRSALRDAGVDLTTIEFVELPPPNMNAALESGQVDGAWLVEPFITLAQQTLEVEIGADVFTGATENIPVAGWVTTPQYSSENPEAVEAFIRAMDRASEIAIDDPAKIAAIIPTYTEIPAEIAEQMSPISFVPTSDFSGLSTIQDLMIDFGYYDEPLDLDALISPLANG
jgi:NitT/TauT family transport system substrate-binding protein